MLRGTGCWKFCFSSVRGFRVLRFPMTAFTHPHDAALLGMLQEAVPFTAHPFADLGERCGLGEDETLASISRL